MLLLLIVVLAATEALFSHRSAGEPPRFPVAATHLAPAPHSLGQVLHLTIPSPALGTARTAVVYLPPGYADPANRSRRYPVLYLLSGAPGAAEDWFRHMDAATTADHLLERHAIPPLILVSPDANGGPHRDSQFLNSFDGRHPVETFLAHDVVTYVDTHFRTLRTASARGLAGYSAGAYGALNVGLHHPDLFGVLAGFSGYYTADPSEVTHPSLNHPMSHDPAFLHFNSPSITITTLHPNQWPRIVLVESTIDGHYTDTTHQFDTELTRLGVPHTTRFLAPSTPLERKTWRHSFAFVAHAFHLMLPTITAGFPRP